MSTHLHIDGFSGLSGDMFLGALIDLGLPLRTLERGLKALGLQGYRLQASQVIRNSLRATKVDVNIRSGFTKPLTLAAIRKILIRSGLSASTRSKALGTFQFIAEAEGAVHGKRLNHVHFHEVGVIDSLVDIVGTLLGMTFFEIETISVSPINLGAGTVSTAHGQLPVPGPAVAHMAQGIPVYSAGPAIELTTPTGMALVKTLSSDFRPLPALTPHKVGYGAGTADPPGWPNVLRVFLQKRAELPSVQSERIILLETNIDDMNPQLYERVMECLFQAGALDVTFTPTMMKRNRPGIVLSVIGFPHDLQALQSVLFTDTSTLGIRLQEMDRIFLPRTSHTIRVLGGTVRMKAADLGHGRTKVTPEYRDCLALAQHTHQSVQTVMDLARRTYERAALPSSRRLVSGKSPRRQ